MSDKIYCGSGKEKFEGNLVEVSLCVSDLPKDKIFEYNGKKYIKLKVVKKREIDEYGKSHYIEVDMFEPNQNQGNQSFRADDIPPPEDDDSGLPF